MPALTRFRVDPEIAQFSGDELENETTPPLEAVALRGIDLFETFSVDGGVNEIVCALLVISKVCLYRSDAKYVEVAEVSYVKVQVPPEIILTVKPIGKQTDGVTVFGKT